MKKFLTVAVLVAATLGLAGNASASPSPSPYVGRTATALTRNAGTLADVSPAPSDPLPSASPSATSPPPADQQLVFIGDSITGGALVASAERINAEVGYRLCGLDCGKPGHLHIRNEGQGGQQLLGGTNPLPLATTFPGVLATMSAGDILVMDIGMNDLWSYDGDGPWTSAYTAIVTSAIAKGVRVLVTEITPLGSVNWARESLREALNGWIDSVFSDRVLRYSDVLHGSGTVWIDSRLGWYDGVHVNEGGYALMADMVASRLRSSLWLVA